LLSRVKVIRTSERLVKQSDKNRPITDPLAVYISKGIQGHWPQSVDEIVHVHVQQGFSAFVIFSIDESLDFIVESLLDWSRKNPL
jgi:hypothetical protein